MQDILALLQHLNPIMGKTVVRQMSQIIYGMLAMSGRITMLGIARWTETGGSYRTVQRFFHTTIAWGQVMWAFFCTHLAGVEDEYIMAGDECVVTKAGKRTYGLDQFFSSLFGKPVPSVAFFALSLISCRQRRSYPLLAKQVIRTEAEKAAAKQKKEQKKAKQSTAGKRKVGRPKGSKNRNKSEVILTPELKRISQMIQQFLELVGQRINLVYLALDGHFGNNNALQMVRQHGLHLISKLRSDAALFFSYEGEDKRRKYGDKVNYDCIPVCYRRDTTTAEGIRTDIYQAKMLQKEFAQPLNVVLIVKTKLDTQATARVILFSSDLDLSWTHLIDYYRLRFQIEFNFRDAKQYWGLEDFMAVKESPVTNAINLSLFMVNVSQLLLHHFRHKDSNVNVLDLKAFYRAHKYVTEMIKLLSEKPDPILMGEIFDKVSQLGRIHPSSAYVNSG